MIMDVTLSQQKWCNILSVAIGALGLILTFRPYFGFLFFPLTVIAIVLGIMGRNYKNLKFLGGLGIILGCVSILFQALFLYWVAPLIAITILAALVILGVVILQNVKKKYFYYAFDIIDELLD